MAPGSCITQPNSGCHCWLLRSQGRLPEEPAAGASTLGVVACAGGDLTRASHQWSTGGHSLPTAWPRASGGCWTLPGGVSFGEQAHDARQAVYVEVKVGLQRATCWVPAYLFSSLTYVPGQAPLFLCTMEVVRANRSLWGGRANSSVSLPLAQEAKSSHLSLNSKTLEAR